MRPPAADLAISELRRIVKAYSLLFLAVSVLFLLPPFFSIAVYPTFQRVLLDSSSSSSSSSNPYDAQTCLNHSFLPNQPLQRQRSGVDPRSVLISVGYTSFFTLLSIFAAGFITYSVVQGFYGRLVTLLSAIRSIVASFPFLAMVIYTQAIISWMVIVYGILGFLILKVAESVIGDEISYSSTFLLILVASIVVVLVLVLVYFEAYYVFVELVELRLAIGTSFFPLLAKLIYRQVNSWMVIVVGILGFLILQGSELVIGHEISYSSTYFLVLAASIVVVLLLVLAYLQVYYVCSAIEPEPMRGSFFPLFPKFICDQAIVSWMVIISGILGSLILKGAEPVIGDEISYSSTYFLVLVMSIVVVLVLVLAYFQVYYVLVYVILMADSGHHSHPLRRSAYLVRGMRRVASSVILFFGVLSGILVWMDGRMRMETSESVVGGNEWKHWHFVVQIVATSNSLTMQMLLSLAANVVLYMYCRELG